MKASLALIIFIMTGQCFAAQIDGERFRQVALLAYAVRDSMRDPDSIVFEEALANADASIVCFRYRARNGYGGMNREIVAYAVGKASTSIAFWAKHCTRSDLIDMREAAAFAANYKR